jgi:hypothetical protein
VTYRLFIDDERDPPADDGHTWTVVRTVDAARSIVVALGIPSFIAFDHDLGATPEGGTSEVMRFVHWLKDFILDTRPDLGEFDFYVHSQNPIGRKNIEGLLHPLIAYARAGYP